MIYIYLRLSNVVSKTKKQSSTDIGAIHTLNNNYNHHHNINCGSGVFKTFLSIGTNFIQRLSHTEAGPHRDFDVTIGFIHEPIIKRGEIFCSTES